MTNNNINKDLVKSSRFYTAIFEGYKPKNTTLVDMHFREIHNYKGVFIKKDLLIDCTKVPNAVGNLRVGQKVEFFAKLVVDATDKVEGNTFDDIVIILDKNN